MEPLMDLPKLRVCDVGIDLGRGDVFVAQELLDRAEISAVSQKICRKGVPEPVWRDFNEELCLPLAVGDDS